MKLTLNLFKPISFVILLLVSGSMAVAAQDSKKQRDSLKAETITKLVTERDYVFEAQSASPMKGGRINLNGGYTLVVSKDTVTSDLPYYGRAYQSDYGSSNGGIKFTSTDFDYETKERKKGGWEITIKPKDFKKLQQLILTIFSDGTTTVQVNSNDRQPISFSGYIEARKPRK
jgi:hypothetical protein